MANVNLDEASPLPADGGDDNEEIRQSEASDEQTSQYEEEASHYGWVPQEQFRGNPNDWVDAQTFIERGKEINPILRANNERLLRELRSNKAELEEMRLTVKEFGEQYKKMQEAAYARAIKEVKEQLRDARRADDPELEGQLEEQLETLQGEKGAIKNPGELKPEQKEAAARQAIMQDWMGRNQWYNPDKNPILYDAAEGYAMRLAKRNPELVGKAEFLEKVTDYVREQFPEKFSNQERKRGSPVDSGSETRAGGRSSGKKGYADLPPDAKAACDRFAKNIPDFDKDQYAKDYFAS